MRDLTPNMATELESANIAPILLAQLEFDSGTLYMWNGYGTLTWEGKDYLGGGNLVTVATLEETQELEAKSLVVTLSGIPTSLLSLALNERTRGRAFRMWLGAMDTGGSPLQLIGDPYRAFTGLMDVMEISDDGDTALIRLSVESSLLIGQRVKVFHYTSEDQKKTYPNDLGLDMINQLQDKAVIW